MACVFSLVDVFEVSVVVFLFAVTGSIISGVRFVCSCWVLTVLVGNCECTGSSIAMHFLREYESEGFADDSAYLVSVSSLET